MRFSLIIVLLVIVHWAQAQEPEDNNLHFTHLVGTYSSGQVSSYNEELRYTHVQGHVFINDTEEPLEGALVELEIETSKTSTTTDSTGYFAVAILESNDSTGYRLKASADGFLASYMDVDPPAITGSKRWIYDFGLRPATGPEGPFIEINFITDSVTVDTTATMLQLLYMIMIENPTIVVELGGHCGLEEDTTLALPRAQFVAQYLIERGISAERIEAVGYGSSRPLFTEEEIAAEGEPGQQHIMRLRNQRVGLLIISY